MNRFTDRKIHWAAVSDFSSMYVPSSYALCTPYWQREQKQRCTKSPDTCLWTPSSNASLRSSWIIRTHSLQRGWFLNAIWSNWPYPCIDIVRIA